ncbi:MAG: ATP-dependent Clp protease proteolytic subunit [Bacteroidota bacterium]
MNFSEEFRKFAVKDKGIGGIHVDKYAEISAQAFQNSLTPYIIEERRMNATVLDVFSRLMMDRILFLGTDVNFQVANILTAQMLFLESVDPKRDMQLFINSPGGSVIDGMGIYDVMQYVSPDVATICTGLAASMGAVLLASGTAGKRSALPHARVMIHQLSGGMRGTFSDMEINFNLSKQLRDELYTILADHCGRTFEEIEKGSDRDNWMKAPVAKEFGLIDEVLTRGKEA